MDTKRNKLQKTFQLKKVDDPVLARTLLAEAVLTQAMVSVLGLPNQKSALKGKYTQDEDGKFSFWIEFSNHVISQNQKIIEEVKLPIPLTFNVSILDIPTLKFEANLVQIVKNKFKFQVPTEVYFEKKRKFRRFKILAGYENYIKVPDPHSRSLKDHRLYDLSYEGLCFLVNPDERLLFSVGTKLDPVSLTLFGKTFSIGLIVRAIGHERVQLGDLFGVAIRAEFEFISPKEKAIIQNYVDYCFLKNQTFRHRLY